MLSNFLRRICGTVLQGDVESAYLQADLGGKATWLRLPKSLRHKLPEHARNMSDPVVRLLKALYGHPRAGGDWDHHFTQLLKGGGWNLIEDEKSLFLSPCGQCVLAIYVDDLLCGGPVKETHRYMDDISRLVRMGRMHPL